jgi:hypothetical protein
MIDERFLIAAVNIRRKYLKLSSNLDLYRDKAEGTLEELQKAKEKLTKIEKGDYDKENLSGLQEILNIIVGLEESQESFEKTLEPLNKEIEKLLIEEKELYDQICKKHSNYDENQIVNIVKERLQKENLL